MTSDIAGVPTVVQQGPHFANPGAPVYVVTGGAGEPLWHCLPGPGCPDSPVVELFTMTILKVNHQTEVTIEDNVLRIQPINLKRRPH